MSDSAILRLMDAHAHVAGEFSHVQILVPLVPRYVREVKAKLGASAGREVSIEGPCYQSAYLVSPHFDTESMNLALARGERDARAWAEEHIRKTASCGVTCYFVASGSRFRLEIIDPDTGGRIVTQFAELPILPEPQGPQSRPSHPHQGLSPS